MGKKNRMKTKDITTIGILAAIICVIAPFSLPIGVVPISLTTAVIMLVSSVFPGIKAILAVLIYILIGLVGIPVFSNFRGGIGQLLGPTGGYIIGYLFLAVIVSLFSKKNNRVFLAIGLIVGTIVLYGIGTAWMAVATKIDFLKAITIGVLPFIVPDAAKIAAVTILAPILKKKLKKQITET